MRTVSARGNCYVSAIVHNQRRTEPSADWPQGHREFIKLAGLKILFPQLHRNRARPCEFGAPLKRGFDRCDQPSTRCRKTAIGDEVELKTDLALSFRHAPLTDKTSEWTRRGRVKLGFNPARKISEPPGLDRKLHRPRHRQRIFRSGNRRIYQ